MTAMNLRARRLHKYNNTSQRSLGVSSWDASYRAIHIEMTVSSKGESELHRGRGINERSSWTIQQPKAR
jgi:hypothetical protein